MERLFGEVLPSHPTRQSLLVDPQCIPSSCIRLFTESILSKANPCTPLREIGFVVRNLRHDDAQVIATMVERNVDLEHLLVKVAAEEDGRRLCHAVARNSYLRNFTLCVDNATADALDGVASPTSSLRTLTVQSRFSDGDGVADLARQLRTNTTITSLSLMRVEERNQPELSPSDIEMFRPILDVLETYNFRLVDVEVIELRSAWAGLQPRVGELLRRNARIQRALADLEPQSYRVEPNSLVPPTLGLVSALPTLLYRFLRRGNVNRLFARQFRGGTKESGCPTDNTHQDE